MMTIKMNKPKILRQTIPLVGAVYRIVFNFRKLPVPGFQNKLIFVSCDGMRSQLPRTALYFTVLPSSGGQTPLQQTSTHKLN